MKKKTIKIVGLIATLTQIVAPLITDWIDEKELEKEIDEKVNEAVNKRLEGGQNL